MSFTVFDIAQPISTASVLDTEGIGIWTSFVSPDVRNYCVTAWTFINEDTVDYQVDLGIGQSLVAQYNIPARTGFDGNPPIDIVKAYLAATGMDLLVSAQFWSVDIRTHGAPTDGTVFFGYVALGGYF